MKNRVLILFGVIIVLSALILGGCRTEEEEWNDAFGTPTPEGLFPPRSSVAPPVSLSSSSVSSTAFASQAVAPSISPSPSMIPSPSPSMKTSPSTIVAPSPLPSLTTSVTPSSQAVTKWDLTGKWVLIVSVEGGNTYNHDWSLTQSGSTLSGTGSQGSNIETLTGTNSMGADGPITIHSAYKDSTYYWDLTGIIDKDGKLSGKWKDNYNPVHTGTFTSISGGAKPIP